MYEENRTIELLFLGFLLTSSLAFGFLVRSAHASGPFAQDPKVENQDVVYSDSEVDVQAVITNFSDVNPLRYGASIDCKGTAEVHLTMVLRKSGKVSDVKIVKAAKCSLDRKAVASVKKIKFKAAEKNGEAVSQLAEISFKQTVDY